MIWQYWFAPVSRELKYNPDYLLLAIAGVGSTHFFALLPRGLNDGILAERLAMIDPTECANLEELRQELLDIIEERLDESEYLRWAVATDPFEFIRSQIIVFDTDQTLERPEELAQLLPHLSVSSIFYHFIDARRRLPPGDNDFQLWVSSFNGLYNDLAKELAAIDPYFATLTELRQQITLLFNRYC